MASCRISLENNMFQRLAGQFPHVVFQRKMQSFWEFTYSNLRLGLWVQNGCFNELIHPEDRKNTWKTIEDELRISNSYSVDYRLKNRETGEYFWVNESGTQAMVSGELMLEGFIRDKSLEVELENKAFRDPLTGVFNRQFLKEKGQGIVDRNKEGSLKTGLIVLDIDDFKEVNEGFGHHGGDDFLKEFSLRVKSIIRESDYLVRLGGDEFLVIVGVKGAKELLKVAEKIQENVGRKKFSVGRRSCSIGAALIKNCSFDYALKEADKNLFLSKRTGKDKVSI